ncbi:acyltransferase [Flexivirga meconopsidis]|uniref:acyltransferase n=1 Tax=Flexivirga meconopsidis TaxID=2977121 RepID=UPI00223FF397|nr:acyltransferase [Flexivirga meconopsidis]
MTVNTQIKAVAARMRRAGYAVARAGVCSSLAPEPLRVGVLRATGALIEPTTSVRPRVHMSDDVRLGADSSVGEECLLQGPLTLGDRSHLGPRTLVITYTHQIGGHELRCPEPPLVKPVTIGTGCWIGAGTIILPGVTIGDGVIVAAGAVVTKDCEPDSLYAGVPARLIRRLP